MTLNINDTIVYGMDGVCKVIGKALKKFSGQADEYYVLQPVYKENTTIYIPVNGKATAAKVRRVLTAQQIFDLIVDVSTEPTVWVADTTRRREECRKIIAGGDRRQLIQMIRTLDQHSRALQDQGKKMHMADERFIKEAEKILYEEFAHVLDIQTDQLLPFILRQIEVKQRAAQH